jgi:GT2 family glycosyltransferase/glycosyltransferase involved in cell wall biosynthesis
VLIKFKKIIEENKFMMNSKSVTIIVPIYNAYQDTQKCLESLLKYTDSKHKILLMDDASSDSRIEEFTKSLASQYSHVFLIRNTKNVGFVKNCNIAFRESDGSNDVVILNSDTIVTPNWLEKLIDAACSCTYVATVTPLTNNGTVCSIPNWLEINEIPKGQTIDSFANLIEKISLRKYPRIPTAVGFCTYIKREVLNKVGYFDEVNFIKGYGEENDFSCRASKLGYFHIIDDSTFVYHAGSKSFKSEKQKLIEENSKVLAKLHPNYFPEVHSFIAANPLKEILDNIQLHLKIEEIKRLSPICFILHNSVEAPINHPLGGTEYHCAALISNLSLARPVYTLYYNNSRGLLEFDIFYKEQKLSFSFSCEFQYPYKDKYFHHEAKFLQLIIGIFYNFKPSLIHIHHLIGLPIADVVSALKQLRIPYLVSLHDYYLICPSYNLIDYKEKFCVEHKSIDYCQTCIRVLFDQGEELKKQWSNICQELLQGSEAIIAPSQTALSYFEKEYPQLHLHKKSQVIQHGIFCQSDLREKIQNLKNQSNNHFSLPLKVALVGSINTAKGAKVFISLLEQIWSDRDLSKAFSFEIIGRFNLVLPTHIQNIKFGSEYCQKDLGKLLENVDIVIFPNIWAETYCLTVDEVLAHGIPVILTPLNAASNRVRDYKVGWVTHSVSATDLLKELIFVKENPQEFFKVKENIKKYPLVSYEEMTQKYVDEYSRINTHNIDTNNEFEQALIPKEISEAYFLKSRRLLSMSQEEQIELQRLQLMIKAMESSKLWKLRTAWFRLKQVFGIAVDDWWMKERGSQFK